jgi:hypothetical protein
VSYGAVGSAPAGPVMPRRGGELWPFRLEQRDDLSILSRELMTWVRDVGAGDLEESRCGLVQGLSWHAGATRGVVGDGGRR